MYWRELGQSLPSSHPWYVLYYQHLPLNRALLWVHKASLSSLPPLALPEYGYESWAWLVTFSVCLPKMWLFPKATRKLPGEGQFPAAFSLENKCNRSPIVWPCTTIQSINTLKNENSSSKIVQKGKLMLISLFGSPSLNTVFG